MKQKLCILISLILCLSLLTGCAPAAEDGGYDIAIVMQMDHSSLEEIRAAIEEELEVLAEEMGVQIRCRVFNGQNDATVLNQIGSQIMADSYDAIIPIATLAAQCMATAAGGQIPVVYAAVSDPEGNGLTGLENVTGTSDALDTAFLLEMMLAANPDIQTVGLLYSNSEANSQAAVVQAKAYLEARGITYIEKTGNTSGDIIAAASSLAGRVDAVFTPTDNAVMAAEASVAQILCDAGIPHYAGADSFVTAGAFAACGVSYTELGKYTSRMAVEVITTGEVPEFHVMEGGIVTVNAVTAEQLGLDTRVFREMAENVVEVG